MEQNELYHHGIKGMRWGVRRYQNADGSLTPAGKKRALKMQNDYTNFSSNKRYRDKDGNLTYSGRKKALKMKEQYSELTGGKQLRKFSSNSNTKAKSFRDMSDSELKDKTNRLIAEKNYLEAKRNLDTLTPKQVSKGKAIVKEYGPAVAKTLWNDIGKKYVEQKLGLNDSGKSASQKLKQKAEDMENRKKIANAEDFFKKREEKQAAEKNTEKSSKNSSEKSSKNSSESSKKKTETETYSGTVEGEGTSSKKKSSESSNFSKRYDEPIDAEWRDITNDVYNSGKNYVNQFLLEDKKKR